MIPACRWGVYGFRPSFYRPRRVFAEGDQHRIVTRPHGNVTSPTYFPDVLPPQAANGPTRIRFELVRAGASPLQARSTSKWIRRFGPGFAAAKPPWSAGTCYRFLAYSRPQTPQFARSRSPNSDLRSPIPRVLDVRSLAGRRLPQSRPRQEPRKTRNTRKAEQFGLAHAALRVSIPSVPKGRS